MWEMKAMDGRRYNKTGSSMMSEVQTGGGGGGGHTLPHGQASTSEDLHAWSIFRQNLNSDFTDSALGSSEKSPMPYGNFHLRESTMHSILSNPKYGPKSELGANMYTYLKFGLPRVLPPLHKRENSSGYDSTDEETHHHTSKNRSNGVLRSARSEDFLNYGREEIQFATNYKRNRDRHPQSAINHRRLGTSSNSTTDRRYKSASEANLLSPTSYYYHQDDLSGTKTGRLRSLARSRASSTNRISSEKDLRDGGAFVNRGMEMDEDDDEEEEIDTELDKDSVMANNNKLGGNKAASTLSILSKSKINGVSYRNEAPMVNDKYFPKDRIYGSNGNFLGGGLHGADIIREGTKYPHLQIRGLNFEIRRYGHFIRLLDDISLDVKGGELLSIMATKEDEGTALCDIIANSFNHWNTRLDADIILNGISVNTKRLEDRVSYVKRNINFSPDMSVRQTMLFHSFLREPGTHTRNNDTKGRINALIEDLGLVQVKHTRVKDLTVSERQRLNVAAHLLMDTDIVVLDQPTRGMDIFDTFFLVEYLRQWAGRGRIVIITLHPPTYEILTMISKILLISTGRSMYYGKRREMLPYFALIEYPCPAFKNPSDYYLDLVTLDDLSSEAMLESSQRIDQLASTFKRRMEPLPDPGPPGVLPSKIKRANFLDQIFGLWIRALIYMYPFNVIEWVKMVLLSGGISILVGVIFLGIRWQYWDREWQENPTFDQDNINDRLGFHHVMMSVGIWPMMMAMITNEWANKMPISRDVDDKLYSKMAYIFIKTLYSIPGIVGIFLAYIIPGYLLAGIHYQNVNDLDVFYYYIGYMMLYLLSIRMMIMCFVHLSSSRHWASAMGGTILVILSLVNGYVIHVKDLGDWTSWIKYVSPQYWMNHPIQRGEFSPISIFHCKDNPVITENSIIKQVPCGLSSGNKTLDYFQFGDKFQNIVRAPWYIFMPIFLTLFFYAFWQILCYVFYLGRTQKARQSRSRKSKV
ncbi:ATP-binding cassette sub-family G member 8 [Lepeophtheirus salmonis]|uniref:ATP-binding cassette sub-family G member 8 n=1 Tax=Lepeophtheirus salmonis TaxID=72036 RepID=UPI001AE427A2|nr:ABC transporter G family member 5-like [Lepeophtheirus salmonis]XP_040564086.1 ABC transporter G family member 5-like [Lepeophtheirus salmonis]